MASHIDLEAFPEFMTQTADQQEPPYEQIFEAEVHILQRIAPLVEGSFETKESLLTQITAEIDSFQMSAAFRQCLKEPEELLNACFTKQTNLTSKMQDALSQIKYVDSSQLPQQTWKVNFLEMLEPRYKATEVRQLRS